MIESLPTVISAWPDHEKLYAKGVCAYHAKAWNGEASCRKYVASCYFDKSLDGAMSWHGEGNTPDEAVKSLEKFRPEIGEAVMRFMLAYVSQANATATRRDG